MRSTFFVILSVLVHAACAVALVMVPSHALNDDAGDKVEVRIGEPAQKPGLAQAPDTQKDEEQPKETAEQSQAEKPVEDVKKSEAKAEPLPPKEEKPVAKKEEPKPVAKKVAKKPAAKKAVVAKVEKDLPAKKAAPEKLDPVIDDQDMAVDQAAPSSDEQAAQADTQAAPAKDQTPAVTSEDVADQSANSNTDANSADQSAPATATATQDKLIPVKDTDPDGVAPDTTGDDNTEANANDANAEDPAPVTVKAEDPGEAALSKGGASKQGAVSYLDLRQMPGNQPPAYPLQARLEKRQGSLELLYRVTKSGDVTDIQVAKSSGYKDLDTAAIDAIAKYKFVPGQEGWARHPVTFELKGPAATLPSILRGGPNQAQAEDED